MFVLQQTSASRPYFTCRLPARSGRWCEPQPRTGTSPFENFEPFRNRDDSERVEWTSMTQKQSFASDLSIRKEGLCPFRIPTAFRQSFRFPLKTLSFKEITSVNVDRACVFGQGIDN